MKRILGVILGLTLSVVAGCWFYFASSSRQAGYVNGSKVLAAARTYQDDLKRQGSDVPTSVSLKEMIARGLLTETDVSGFSGMDVTVTLPVDEGRPQTVLVRSRLPDGDEIVVLADGSVQQVRH